jgi:hypothetical protein
MPDHASPSARSNPVVFIALLAAVLTSTALIAAALCGVGSGAMQDLLHTAGFGQNSTLAAEQRRQAQALEVVELSVGRLGADMALLNVRISEAESLYREWVNAPPASPAQINPARVIPVQSSSPEFDLDALRTSFDGTADERLGTRRQSPQLARRWRAAHAAKGATVPPRTAPSV